MRNLASIQSESDARRFSVFLQSNGIDHQVEEAPESGWSIWILNDDDLPRARVFLREYRENPLAAAFETAMAEAERDRAPHARRQRPRLFQGTGASLPLSLSSILILVSLALTLYTRFGADPWIRPFLITADTQVDGTYSTLLPEIRAGQFWRLITPMFLHFNALHLLFNIWWLRDLGSMIERAVGRRTLVVLVLVIGVTSHLGQFMISGPRFGGLSGLVFGLLGYAWIRGKYDLTCGLYVQPQVAAIMVMWFLLGFTGLAGPIANVVHGIGLVVGLAYGYSAAVKAAR